MKNILSASALTLTIIGSAAAQTTQSGCFTINSLSVLDSPGNPLPGSSGSGTFEGTYDGVTWDPDSELSGNPSGSFAITTAWNQADVNWTVANGAIQFNTNNNPSALLFGNPVITTDDPNCKVEKATFTVSVCLDEEGVKAAAAIEEKAGERFGMYLQAGDTKSPYALKKDDKGNYVFDATDVLVRDEKSGASGLPENLQYLYSLDGGSTFERSEQITYDTHLSLGACIICTVPEPSAASMSILALGALVTRRKR
ncbi:MAG: PEP-CTERM sorting domain-containing protein [Verrucomicrobiaceae bacterium]